MTPGRTTGHSTTTKETSTVNDMQRTALRQTRADRFLLGLGVAYLLAAASAVAVGYTTTAVVWASMWTVAYTFGVWSTYRINLRSLRRSAEYAAQQHERDLRLERMAQESDITRADHLRRLESIRAGLGDPGASPRAAAIIAERDRRDADREQAERAERQVRIAAAEAAGIRQGDVRLSA